MSDLRLPSWRKSYWIGCCTNRHVPHRAATTITVEAAITQPVCRVSAVAYGPATQPVNRERFFSRSGRTRSAMTISGGISRYVVTQHSSIPAVPMKPNWLNPRKLTAPSEP